MKNFFKKMLDPKFLTAIVAMVTGIMGLFSCEENMIMLVSSAILVIFPAISYMIVEGVVDWNKINDAISEILKIIDEYMASEKETIDNGKLIEENVEVIAGSNKNKEKEVIYKIASILHTIIKE